MRYNKRFQDIPFGAKPDTLLKYVQRNLFVEQAERLGEATDPNVRDNIQIQIKQRLQTIRDSHTAFKGQKTGYNVSVISTDFAHNATESMLVVPVQKSHDYYFFVKDKMWKLVTTELLRGTFPAFIVRMTQLYGAPGAIDYRDPEFKQQPKAARWVGKRFTVEAKVHPVYGAITIRWALREVGDQIAQSRGTNIPPGDETSSGLDPSITDIMQD